MDRQTRQNIKHDKFVDEVNLVASMAQKNMKKVIIALVALVVVIVGWISIVMFRRGVEADAQSRLAEAIETLDAPLKTGTESDTPLSVHVTAAERSDAAEGIFREIIAEWSGSKAAGVASLYLGQIEAQRGEYESAQPRFEEFIAAHPKNVLADSARMGLLQLKIASGAVDEVITEIQTEIGKTEKSLPNDMLLGLLAQAYEIKGDETTARQHWQRIVNEFPDSPYGLEAQRKLAQG